MIPDLLLEELLEALYLYLCQDDDYMENRIWEEICFLAGV